MACSGSQYCRGSLEQRAGRGSGEVLQVASRSFDWISLSAGIFRVAPARGTTARSVRDDMLLLAVEEAVVIGTTLAGYDGHRCCQHKVAVLPKYRHRSLTHGTCPSCHPRVIVCQLHKVQSSASAHNLRSSRFLRVVRFKIEERLGMATTEPEESSNVGTPPARLLADGRGRCWSA